MPFTLSIPRGLALDVSVKISNKGDKKKEGKKVYRRGISFTTSLLSQRREKRGSCSYNLPPQKSSVSHTPASRKDVRTESGAGLGCGYTYTHTHTAS